MVKQALGELPNECCGLLGGIFSTDPSNPDRQVACVVQRYPLVNERVSPIEYLSEPKSMFEAVRDMRRRGLEIVAVYHSHPTAPPVPSRRDLERNYYGTAVIHFIISLQAETPTMGGWWLGEKDFREAEWEVVT
jgi:proteasome lid subunit RPN8/RPN11